MLSSSLLNYICIDLFIILFLFYDGSILDGPRGRFGGPGGPGRPARGGRAGFFKQPPKGACLVVRAI